MNGGACNHSRVHKGQSRIVKRHLADDKQKIHAVAHLRWIIYMILITEVDY